MKKIDQVELDAFKKTLPGDIDKEYFRWITVGFCIPSALFLIKKHNIEAQTLDVKTWCEAMGLSGPREYKDDGAFTIRILNGVVDDDAMEDKINPDIPIIVAEHVWKNNKTKKNEITTLVIDGNKRLRKAFLTGREKVPVYFIPKKLCKLIYI